MKKDIQSDTHILLREQIRLLREILEQLHVKDAAKECADTTAEDAGLRPPKADSIQTLRACPFCGRAKSVVVPDDTSWAVGCAECGAFGPPSDKCPSIAKDYWNHKPGEPWPDE